MQGKFDRNAPFAPALQLASWYDKGQVSRNIGIAVETIRQFQIDPCRCM